MASAQVIPVRASCSSWFMILWDIEILDFSKAFDTVPHNRLLQKLEFYGIQGDILEWISVFLKSRDQCVVVEGQRSGTVSVDSGVPQGTVLGPLLFLLHINDLPSVVSSQVRLFADDCLMYRPIEARGDQEDIQSDLDALQQWGDAWGMRFNAKKCHIMRISRSTRPLSKFYSLCNTIISEVNCAKYLGINITSDLQWSNHISGISSQANSSLGFIWRNLRSCPQKLKEVAYISMVRYVMEYSAIIWDPHLRKDIDLLERVQRRAARFVKTDYNPRSSVTQMIQDLGWSDLAHRRRDLRLALLYKVVFCDYVVTAEDLQLVKADKRTRSNHPNKLRHIRADSTELLHFFPVNTVEDWNHLPASVIASPSLASFKTWLAQRERVD